MRMLKWINIVTIRLNKKIVYTLYKNGIDKKKKNREKNLRWIGHTLKRKLTEVVRSINEMFVKR